MPPLAAAVASRHHVVRFQIVTRAPPQYPHPPFVLKLATPSPQARAKGIGRGTWVYVPYVYVIWICALSLERVGGLSRSSRQCMVREGVRERPEVQYPVLDMQLFQDLFWFIPGFYSGIFRAGIFPFFLREGREEEASNDGTWA